MISSVFYGWKILGALWVVIFVNMAFPLYGGSVINSYMAADFGLDRKTLGLIFSVFVLMTGLPGPLAAICVDKMGARFTLIMGSLAVVVSAILMGTVVDNSLSAIIVFGLIMGLGSLCGGLLSTQACIAFWFVRRRARSLSIIYIASSVGGIVAAPLLNYVISETGNWRMAWLLIAGLACISLIIIIVIVKNTPQEMGLLPDGDMQENDLVAPRVHMTAEDWTMREVLRSPVLWGLLLSTIGMVSGFTLFIGHGIVHLKDLGHSPTMAAMAMSIMVAGGMTGKTIVGIFGDRVEPRYLWIAGLIIFSFGLVWVVNAETMGDIVIFSFCLGIGSGSVMVLLMVTLSHYFGSKVFAQLTGLTLAVLTMASSSSPLIGGYLYDLTGSYAETFYSIAVLCCVGVVTLLIIRPPTRHKVTSPSS